MENRVIKFQSIHKHFNTGEIVFSEWGPEGEGSFKGPSYIHGYKQIGHRQFTGLHDKEGVEIYDQDIIDIVAGNPYDIIEGLHKVVWRLSGWYIEPCDGSEYTDVDNSDLALYNFVRASVVVGSSLTHPHLLEKQ